MSDSKSRAMVAVPNHPGIFERGSRYIVVFRQRGRQHKKSFRTLTEARRFKRDTDSGVQAVATQGFIAYANGWLEDYSRPDLQGPLPRERAMTMRSSASSFPTSSARCRL